MKSGHRDTALSARRMATSWQGSDTLSIESGVAVHRQLTGAGSHIYAPVDEPAMLQVLKLPAVAGMHVMPVSKAGRRLAMQLAKDNVFQR